MLNIANNKKRLFLEDNEDYDEDPTADVESTNPFSGLGDVFSGWRDKLASLGPNGQLENIITPDQSAEANNQAQRLADIQSSFGALRDNLAQLGPNGQSALTPEQEADAIEQAERMRSTGHDIANFDWRAASQPNGSIDTVMTPEQVSDAQDQAANMRGVLGYNYGKLFSDMGRQVQGGATSGPYSGDDTVSQNELPKADWGKIWGTVKDKITAGRDWLSAHGQPNGRFELSPEDVELAQARAKNIGLAQQGLLSAAKHLASTYGNQAQREWEGVSDGATPQEAVETVKNAWKAIRDDYQKTGENQAQLAKNGIDINNGLHGNMPPKEMTGGKTPSELGSQIASSMKKMFSAPPTTAPVVPSTPSTPATPATPDGSWYDPYLNAIKNHKVAAGLAALGVPTALAGAHLWNKSRKKKQEENGGR